MMVLILALQDVWIVTQIPDLDHWEMEVEGKMIPAQIRMGLRPVRIPSS